jgi:hypothetical protein
MANVLYGIISGTIIGAGLGSFAGYSKAKHFKQHKKESLSSFKKRKLNNILKSTLYGGTYGGILGASAAARSAERSYYYGGSYGRSYAGGRSYTGGRSYSSYSGTQAKSNPFNDLTQGIKTKAEAKKIWRNIALQKHPDKFAHITNEDQKKKIMNDFQDLNNHWEDFQKSPEFHKLAMLSFRDELEKIAKKSSFQVLKDNKVPLSDEERQVVMDRKAVWHHGPNGEETPAVWKSINKKTGKTFFVTNTHRVFNFRPTLSDAISRYHKFIKGTA